MRPYFAVGEEVILCSKAAPHLNGEYCILDIKGPVDAKCVVKGSFFYGYMYRLSAGINGCHWFFEKTLRKKHDPCGESLSELIQSTKQLVKS